MPAPTNISFATAIDLGTTLPANASQTVDFAGTTYTVYYSYTAQSGDPPVLGLFAFGDLAVYKPSTDIYIGPAGSPTLLFLGGQNKPSQFLVTAGTQYFFKVNTNGGNPTPANLTLNLQRFANASYPTGSIGVSDDTDGFPIAVLSSTTALPLFFTPLNAAGEASAITTTGILMLNTENGSPSDQVKLFNSTLQLITTLTPFAGKIVRGIATDMTTRFYVNGFGIGTVNAYDTSGNFVHAWTLPDLDNVSQAVTHGNTILYSANVGVASAIRRYDLVNSVGLTDLVAGVATYKIGKSSLLVLADGTIIAAYYGGGSTTNVSVRAYSAAGALLHTYAMGESNADVRLAMAIDDPVSFWLWTKDLTAPGGTSTGFSTFRNIRVSDGALLSSLNSAEYEHGVYVPAATATPVRFGHSESCPFWITRVGPSTPTFHTTELITRRQRTAPHLSQEQMWIFYNQIQVDLQAGQGLVIGQGSQPVLMIDWSDDGGHTYSNEHFVTCSPIGMYRARAILRRLGRSRDRIFRVTVSDPVAWNLVGAYLQLEPGVS
jgi:hypothetical protein